MNAPEAQSNASSSGQWRRVVRPLAWWLLLVLGLWGYRQHERRIAETHLLFTVAMGNKTLGEAASVNFDGFPFESGQRVSLGRHQLVVTHPKGEHFSTNLFIWYGERNLGQLSLRRTQGTLKAVVSPKAPSITITGSEWERKLNDSTGLSSAVPADTYRITANYDDFTVERTVVVPPDREVVCEVAPVVGSLKVACVRQGSSFELYHIDQQGSNGRLVRKGELPAMMQVLETGDYKLRAEFKGLSREWPLSIAKGGTNDLEVDFPLGTMVVESTPSGAILRDEAGNTLGVTPVTVREIPAGKWRGKVELQDHLPAGIEAEIEASKTITVQANLLSRKYAELLETARQRIGSGSWDQALELLAEVLRLKADDPTALTLQREAKGNQHFQRGKDLLRQGSLANARSELESVLSLYPGHKETTQLLAELKDQEAQQAIRDRQERAARPRKIFETQLGNYPDRKLFQEHELILKGPVNDVHAGLLKALQNDQPVFEVTRVNAGAPDCFVFQIAQKVEGGLRQGLIVGGQTADNEVRVLFKVFEYRDHHNIKLVGFVPKDEVTHVPIHPDRIWAMTERFEVAPK